MNTFVIQFFRRFAKRLSNWLIGASIAFLIIFHHMSIGWMAESRSLESIMTGGRTANIDTLAVILAFGLLRIIIFILPGFMLCWLYLELLSFIQEKRDFDMVKNKKTFSKS